MATEGPFATMAIIAGSVLADRLGGVRVLAGRVMQWLPVPAITS
jgi:hypothetical protein